MADGDILLNKDFDIVIKDGDIGLTDTFDNSFVQNGRLAINTRKGSNIFHEELGNDIYNDRVKMSDDALVRQYCEDAILSSAEELESVSDIRVVKSDLYNQEMDVSFVLNHIDINIEEGYDDEDEEIDIFEDESIYEFGE